MALASRKYIARSPRMANALEANTRYVSFDTARIAGTESTAKMMSVISTTNSAASKGVAARRPLTRVKNFCPSSSSLTGMILRSNAEPARRFVLCLVGAVADDLGARVDEEDAEHQQQPPEAADQRAAEDDEDRAHREGAEDAPEQHAVLVLQRERPAW